MVENSKKRIGLALSGGGSRAIAFHLGCLKALNNLGILDKVEVISSVSGGSVISALYSYSKGPFEDFENRMRLLLSKGLQRDFALQFLKIHLTLLILFNFLLFAFTGLIITILKTLEFLITKLLKGRIPKCLMKFRTPVPRYFNRLLLFERMLDKKFFNGEKVTSQRRNNLSVVINACELRTGTAMRFGSKESGCWRFGKIIDNDVKIATAVTASAAFPVLLPALDRKWNLINRDEEKLTERLLITDGGVFDNLGITCLEPGKSSKYSYNAYSCDFIICCNAGQGQFELDDYPSWWATRMKKAFLSVFRKVQDINSDKLHCFARNKEIEGFVYAYLGQQDCKLPSHPDDFIRREEVCNYPTNFAGMKGEDMDKLIKRGEQLMEILLSYHLPQLLVNNQSYTVTVPK